MDTVQINTALWPNAPAMLTVTVGDRVRHWSGNTGIVTDISREYAYMDEYPGGERPVYTTHITVQPDLMPRQRKAYPPARWDGIVAVIDAMDRADSGVA